MGIIYSTILEKWVHSYVRILKLLLLVKLKQWIVSKKKAWFVAWGGFQNGVIKASDKCFLEVQQ